ncbi:MAG: hypothetical protein UT02_C0041G0001 [Parcubacteria group bacterium GW2011_GWC2_38_7]|nr:MAG: hypothetical protein UT02_C0041G0001 [Parcubacteria group bacterium GW2011_GWC2_38_7]
MEELPPGQVLLVGEVRDVVGHEPTIARRERFAHVSELVYEHEGGGRRSVHESPCVIDLVGLSNTVL